MTTVPGMHHSAARRCVVQRTKLLHIAGVATQEMPSGLDACKLDLALDTANRLAACQHICTPTTYGLSRAISKAVQGSQTCLGCGQCVWAPPCSRYDETLGQSPTQICEQAAGLT